MPKQYSGSDRREFLRFTCRHPLQYSVLKPQKRKSRLLAFIKGMSNNLSASGMLFTTRAKEAPKLMSLLAFELDYRAVIICQEIENRALIINDMLLGKVMRVEDNEDGSFGVGVAFITKSDTVLEDIKELAM